MIVFFFVRCSVHTTPKESAVGKKMATATFTYNALRTKTLKERIKTHTKNCKSFKLDKSNAVSVGMTAIKPYLFICLRGLSLVRKVLW